MLLIGAVLGIVSPSGNEVGPFSAVEIGMLSQLCEPQNRVFLMQWYQASPSPPFTLYPADLGGTGAWLRWHLAGQSVYRSHRQFDDRTGSHST